MADVHGPTAVGSCPGTGCCAGSLLSFALVVRAVRISQFVYHIHIYIPYSLHIFVRCRSCFASIEEAIKLSMCVVMRTRPRPFVFMVVESVIGGIQGVECRTRGLVNLLYIITTRTTPSP